MSSALLANGHELQCVNVGFACPSALTRPVVRIYKVIINNWRTAIQMVSMTVSMDDTSLCTHLGATSTVRSVRARLGFWLLLRMAIDIDDNDRPKSSLCALDHLSTITHSRAHTQATFGRPLWKWSWEQRRAANV